MSAIVSVVYISVWSKILAMFKSFTLIFIVCLSYRLLNVNTIFRLISFIINFDLSSSPFSLYIWRFCYKMNINLVSFYRCWIFMKYSLSLVMLLALKSTLYCIILWAFLINACMENFLTSFPFYLSVSLYFTCKHHIVTCLLNPSDNLCFYNEVYLH